MLATPRGLHIRLTRRRCFLPRRDIDVAEEAARARGDDEGGLQQREPSAAIPHASGVGTSSDGMEPCCPDEPKTRPVVIADATRRALELMLQQRSVSASAIPPASEVNLSPEAMPTCCPGGPKQHKTRREMSAGEQLQAMAAWQLRAQRIFESASRADPDVPHEEMRPSAAESKDEVTSQAGGRGDLTVEGGGAFESVVPEMPTGPDQLEPRIVEVAESMTGATDRSELSVEVQTGGALAIPRPSERDLSAENVLDIIHDLSPSAMDSHEEETGRTGGGDEASVEVQPGGAAATKSLRINTEQSSEIEASEEGELTPKSICGEHPLADRPTTLETDGCGHASSPAMSTTLLSPRVGISRQSSLVEAGNVDVMLSDSHGEGVVASGRLRELSGGLTARGVGEAVDLSEGVEAATASPGVSGTSSSATPYEHALHPIRKAAGELAQSVRGVGMGLGESVEVVLAEELEALAEDAEGRQVTVQLVKREEVPANRLVELKASEVPFRESAAPQSDTHSPAAVTLATAAFSPQLLTQVEDSRERHAAGTNKGSLRVEALLGEQAEDKIPGAHTAISAETQLTVAPGSDGGATTTLASETSVSRREPEFPQNLITEAAAAGQRVSEAGAKSAGRVASPDTTAPAAEPTPSSETVRGEQASPQVKVSCLGRVCQWMTSGRLPLRYGRTLVQGQGTQCPATELTSDTACCLCRVRVLAPRNSTSARRSVFYWCATTTPRATLKERLPATSTGRRAASPESLASAGAGDVAQGLGVDHAVLEQAGAESPVPDTSIPVEVKPDASADGDRIEVTTSAEEVTPASPNKPQSEATLEIGVDVAQLGDGPDLSGAKSGRATSARPQPAGAPVREAVKGSESASSQVGDLARAAAATPPTAACSPQLLVVAEPRGGRAATTQEESLVGQEVVKQAAGEGQARQSRWLPDVLCYKTPTGQPSRPRAQPPGPVRPWLDSPKNVFFAFANQYLDDHTDCPTCDTLGLPVFDPSGADSECGSAGFKLGCPDCYHTLRARCERNCEDLLVEDTQPVRRGPIPLEDTHPVTRGPTSPRATPYRVGEGFFRAVASACKFGKGLSKGLSAASVEVPSLVVGDLLPSEVDTAPHLRKDKVVVNKRPGPTTTTTTTAAGRKTFPSTEPRARATTGHQGGRGGQEVHGARVPYPSTTKLPPSDTRPAPASISPRTLLELQAGLQSNKKTPAASERRPRQNQNTVQCVPNSNSQAVFREINPTVVRRDNNRSVRGVLEFLRLVPKENQGPGRSAPCPRKSAIPRSRGDLSNVYKGGHEQETSLGL
jgi:hypothetical protein